MKTQISKIQFISYFIWILILILSLFLFISSEHVIPSFILFVVNILIFIYALIYTYKNKCFYFFSPILQTLYCIMFYCTLIGLFYFSKFNTAIFELLTKDELFYIKVAFLYFIYIMTIILTFVLTLNLKQPILKLKFLCKNFSLIKVYKYLFISQICLLILLIIIFYLTGYNPLTALLNPSDFRLEYNTGCARFVYIIFKSLLLIHLAIILKYYIIDKLKNIKIYFLSFLLFYLFWAILSGSRATILTPFMLGLYIFTFKNNIKINLKHILITFFMFIFILTFISAYQVYRNACKRIQQGKVVNISKLENKVWKNSISRIDNFSQSIYYFKYLETQYGNFYSYTDFKYKKQIVSQFTNLIPRKFMPDKAYPISGEISKVLYPGAFVDDVTFIFGGLVNSYYTGGLFSVIIDSIIFALFIVFLELSFKMLIKYDLFFMLYICVFIDIPITFFSIGFLNTSQLVSLIAMLFLIYIFLQFLISKRIS